MGRKPNVWSKVEEADGIIKGMHEKQGAVLWTVRPETIIVMGIENKERSKKNKTAAKIRPIKGSEKAIFQINNIPVRYIIEVYWSDYNTWTTKQKQWILFHELLHVHPDYEKTIDHDCKDFKIILDKVGVEWIKKSDELPDLVNDDVKFNLDFRPSVDDYEKDGEENDEIEEGKEEMEDDAKEDKKDEKDEKE